MRLMNYLLAALFTIGLALPSLAHHPGKKLDELMGSKEKYFQVVDKPAPEFVLQSAAGKSMALTDFSGKILVLHFIYTGCPDICPLHAERVAEVQELVAQTPMKDRVQFLTITTDPVNDTRDVMLDYGAAHGLKSDNWVFLTTAANQAEDTTRKLAQQFGHRFIKADGGYQTHSIVTHIIDRNGRWAANFHGLKFEPVNLVLYLNGLTNRRPPLKPAPKPSLWDKLQELL